MQTVSQDYLTIAAGQHRVETRVKIGSTTFGEDSLFGVTVTGALYNTRRFSIGSCVSREIEVRFLLGNATIPRMAKIQPEIRLVNDNGDQSEWIPKGTFWLDTRELDKESGIMTIRGYDSMLKGEQTYISGLTGNWPKYMTTVANEIAGMLGLTMDSRNNLNSTYQMQLPSGYRIREVLGYIAVANCGNWVITDEGKLRLIRVNDTVDSASIGLAATSYEIEEPYQAFSKVELNLSETAYVEAGDNTGRVLVADCPIVSTTVGQTIANNVLSALSGFIYTPLTANGAILDPAMEIGDHITVGTTTSVLATQETHFDSLCASDISAPGDDELDHEYPYESVQERKIERKISEIETSLYIGPNSIVSKVETLSDEFDDVSGEFTLLEQKVNGFTLSAVDNGHTDTIDSDVGELEKDVIYAPSDDSTWFPFVKTSDDYYTSQNAGVDNSFAYGQIFFNFSSPTTVILKCISYGEVNYDYGIVSEVDVHLSQSRTADSTGVLYNFRTESSSTVKEVSVTVPAGSHYISFKYIKDSSTATGGDYFKIRPITRRTVVTPQSTTVKLMSQGVEVSSATINFTGLVKFADLSGNGTTVINGANITTGMIAADRINVSNLHVTKVYYSDSDDYRILQGTVLGSLGAVELGIQNSSLSDAYIVFYGGEFVFAKYNDASAPMLRIIRNSSTIVGNNWELGTVQSPFDILTVKGVSLYDTYDGSTGSLTAYRGHLYFNNTIVI